MNQYNINNHLCEMYENGELPIMLYIFKQDLEKKKFTRPLHSHDAITELGIVYKGSAFYHINYETYLLEEGDIIFYNQNELHELESGEENEIGTYYLGITNLRLHNMPANHFVKAKESYVKKSGAMFPFISSICEQIYQLNAERDEGNVVIQLLCASLIALCIRLDNYCYANLTDSKEDHFAMEIISYMNEHYTERLTLESLAEYFGCSVSYISHVFRKVTGKTPVQYLINRRIGLAQSLLISSDMTATEIATHVGYNNTNYFTTLFSKVVGQTPIDYRKNYLEMFKGKRQQ